MLGWIRHYLDNHGGCLRIMEGAYFFPPRGSRPFHNHQPNSTKSKASRKLSTYLSCTLARRSVVVEPRSEHQGGEDGLETLDASHLNAACGRPSEKNLNALARNYVFFALIGCWNNRLKWLWMAIICSLHKWKIHIVVFALFEHSIFLFALCSFSLGTASGFGKSTL